MIYLTLQEEIQYHMAIRLELPELLAELVSSDQKDEALVLLVQWGTHTKPNSEIWKEAKKLLRKETA